MSRKNPRRFWLSLAVILLLIPAVILLGARLGGQFYYLASVLVILLTLIPFFLVFESRRPQARELVVLAVLCALAVIARTVFAAVPHFKPMAAIILISGLAMGPEAGFLVGAVSAFASNFVFGQGPWTPWQMFAYGAAGFLAGWWTRLHLPRKRLPLAVFGFLTVLIVVGPLLDTCSLFTMSAEVTADAAKAAYLSGLPVNLVHGVATFLTMLLFAPALLEKLDRLKLKYGMLEGGDHAL